MQESQGLQQQTKAKSIPAIVGIVCAAMIVVALFLPYATATSDGAAYLRNHSSQSVMQGFDLTADQMTNMSLVDFARAYLALAEHSYQQLSGIYMGLVVAMAAAALLMALCFAKRRPIGALVFDVLVFVVWFRARTSIGASHTILCLWFLRLPHWPPSGCSWKRSGQRRRGKAT